MATDYRELYSEEIIGRYGAFIEDILRESIEEQDLLVSGELYNSVVVYQNEKGGLTIELNDYGEVLNAGLSGWSTKRDTKFIAAGAGQRTGGMAGISSKGIVYINFDDIVKWTRARGIGDEDVAGAIFYTLKRDGYEKRPWIDQALKAVEVVTPFLFEALLDASIGEMVDFHLVQTGVTVKSTDPDLQDEISRAVKEALTILRKV